MSIRATDPFGQYHTGAAALVELETFAAKQAAFKAAFPSDVAGQKDLARRAIELTRLAANCST